MDVIVSDRHKRYEGALASRYASAEMSENFSEFRKIVTWRWLWLSLATAQQEIGLATDDGNPLVTTDQINEMTATLEKIDFDLAAAEERRRKHDVMAHVYTWGAIAPSAAKIIHLGATSEDIKDNADVIIIRKGFDILLPKLARCCHRLSKFADRYKATPCLGYTHLQPAQLVTMGKRACLWLNDLLRDLLNLQRFRDGLKLKGLKGATGTQASYLTLVSNEEAVDKLELRFAKLAGFDGVESVAGQTYSRKIDCEMLGMLGWLGASLHKIFTDIRLLCCFGEVCEPFGTEQIGSSAMPYKQNPARSERCCGIARHLVALAADGPWTHGVQWLERTLDDSSNRRLSIPEAFLTADSALDVAQFVFEGLTVNEAVVNSRIHDFGLANLISEEVMIRMVRAGADRQQCHEELRRLSIAATERIRADPTLRNDLLDHISNHAFFAPIKDQLASLADAKHLVGLAPQQVNKFLRDTCNPVLSRYPQDALNTESKLTV